MSHDPTAAEKLKRTTNFPLQVKGLYLCPRRNFPPSEHEIIYGKYEITIRLDSDTRLCLDEIDFDHVRSAVQYAIRASGLSTLKKGAIASIPTKEELGDI